MNRKKMLPLLVVAAVILLLAVMLALLTVTGDGEATQGTALCPFTAEQVDRLSYQGSNTDVALLKGSEDNWMLESDPALPLEQNTVQGLVESFVSLTAQRSLREEELAEIPARSETPLMVFSLTGGEETWTLTVDQSNDVADIYYVYDGQGNAYTVAQSDLNGLCKAPRDLYAPQTLTQQSLEDVAELQVGDLHFVQSDGNWTLADDPGYSLDQSAVKKMVNTLCGLQTEWTITAPEQDAAYGLDIPDVTAVLTFTDGSALTVRFGSLVAEDDALCYLASSGDANVVYEVSADHRNAFAVTKESLYNAEATAETAQQEGDVVAQYPVGGREDYADSIE